MLMLNVGCGHRRIEGYTGVDAVQREGTDIVAKADKIPLDDGAVDEIMAVHLFEHFYRWECDTVLAEWKRLLKPAGRLVLEMPDLMKTCRNVVDDIKGNKEPDQMTLWSLYGDPRKEDPFMAHHWAWHPKSLRALLTEHGFDQIGEEPTHFHPVGRANRDFRMVARKSQ